MKKLVIVGAGGYGQTVADITNDIYDKIIFLDDNSKFAVGRCDEWSNYLNDYDIYPAFGNNELRLKFIERILTMGGSVPTIIHNTAYVSPTAKINMGTVVLPKAVIGTNAEVEKGCIVNYGAIIDHGNVIGEGTHVCLAAVIKAENRIPRLSKIEAGEVIENRTYPL